MLIVNQDRNMIVDTTGVVILTDCNVISAITQGNKNVMLACYEEEEKAKEEFHEVLKALENRDYRVYYISKE